MFNIKKHKKSAQLPLEKYLRKENLGPEADDTQPITEKKLPHRTGYEQTITEDQFSHEKEKSAQIIEKQLDSKKSDYVTHRNDAYDGLTIPPINALVEKIRQKRVAEDYKTDKKSHWSQTFDEKKQQGALPKWTKNVGQHDKIVLNNDPNRFTGSNVDPTKFTKDTIKPLVGNITTADVDKVAHGIKTGVSSEHDTAIMAILRLAHDEHRELTNVEKKAVVNLKIARTNVLMQK